MQCDCNGCGGYLRWKAENQMRFEAWLAAREVERREQERVERSIHDEEVEAFRERTVEVAA